MDVKQMTYILTIAQEGGISKAAAKLFITQSALDQQLLKLEHELGTRLFFRSRSSFALTEAGRVYVEYARRMLELKNEAYRIIHDIADRRRGTLSLAFAPERGMEMFMAVYPRFYQSYPEVTVTRGRSASGGSWRCWPGTSWIWASSPGRRGRFRG